MVCIDQLLYFKEFCSSFLHIYIDNPKNQTFKIIIRRNTELIHHAENERVEGSVILKLLAKICSGRMATEATCLK
jgi:hypothetical protein